MSECAMSAAARNAIESDDRIGQYPRFSRTRSNHPLPIILKANAEIMIKIVSPDN